MIFKRHTIIGLIVITALVWLVGCSTQPPVPVTQYYHLPKAISDKKARPKLYDAIVVRRPIANGIYNERAILFAQSAKPLELSRHHYHYWSQAPIYLVQDYLLEFLRQTGVAGQVKTHGRADVTLTITIKRFERLLSSKGDQVLIELEIVSESKKGSIIKVYHQTAPASGSGVYAAVQAFGLTMRKIALQLLDDLSS